MPSKEPYITPSVSPSLVPTAIPSAFPSISTSLMDSFPTKYIVLFLGVLFFVLFLKGCRNMIGKNRNNAHRARANARIQGNNQSTNENGATSPSALTQDETREQKQHNRRSKIQTNILQKVRFCQ
jgi:hypothetical protein